MGNLRKVAIGFQEGTCPLKCKKCHAFGENARNEKHVQKMTLERAKKLVDEIAQMEVVPVIQPSIFTEPFANADLKEIIIYCCSKKVPVNIITNGILLDKEWMDLLIAYLDRKSVISFSLDAVTQETYEKVRGRYSLAELEDKIEYLMSNRGNKGPRISVNFVYEEDNYDEKDAFLEKWKDKADVVHIGVALDEHKKIPDIYRVKDVINKNVVCPFLQETITIDAGGEVRSCQVDAFGETYLGNVFEEGIMQIWNGEKLNALRQKHRTGQLEKGDFCYGCEWGFSTYNFDKVEETDEFLIKIADYAVYYNRKEKS